MRSSRAILLLVAFAVAAGAAFFAVTPSDDIAPDSPPRDLAQLLADSSVRLATVGFDEDADSPAINGLRDAQLGRDGTSIWTLDEYAPFVRRFDFTGRAELRFLNEGDGPLEAKAPYGLALNDSLVAVLHTGALSLYYHDGTPFRTHIGLPVIAEAIGEGCAGAWLVTGRLATPRSTGHASGIFSLTVPREGDPSVAFIRGDTVRGVRWGRERRIVTGHASAVIHDPRAGDGTYFRMSCDGHTLDPLAVAPPRAMHVKATQSGSRMTTTLRIDEHTALPNGFVPVGDGILAAFGSAGISTSDGTRMIFFDAAGVVHEKRLDGHYALFDLRDGDALVYSADPVPGLMLLPVDDLLRSVSDH